MMIFRSKVMYPYQKRAGELIKSKGFSKQKTKSLIGQIKSASPEEVAALMRKLNNGFY